MEFKILNVWTDPIRFVAWLQKPAVIRSLISCAASIGFKPKPTEFSLVVGSRLQNRFLELTFEEIEYLLELYPEDSRKKLLELL